MLLHRRKTGLWPPEKWDGFDNHLRLWRSGEADLPEQVDLLEALRDQQFHLGRLLQKQLLLTETPKLVLDDIAAQLRATKRLLSDLEAVINHRIARNAHRLGDISR